MSTQQNGPVINYTAGATAIEKNTALKFHTDGTLIVTTGGSAEDTNFAGIAQNKAAVGAPVATRILGAGTASMIAHDTFAIGALLYTAASGMVTDTTTSGKAVGVALEAATALNDVVEVAPIS